MKVFVGSQNPVKVEAAKRVFMSFMEKLDHSGLEQIQGVDVSSDVSDQPIGLDQVVEGAVNRAKNALIIAQKNHWITENFSPKVKIFGVGIEAGLVRIPHTLTGFLDFQFCAIVDLMGRTTIGSGSGWEYPPAVIRRLEKDPSLEMGTIMGEISGIPDIKYTAGAIGHYSQGLLNRTSLTEEGIRAALIPWINAAVYFEPKI